MNECVYFPFRRITTSTDIKIMLLFYKDLTPQIKVQGSQFKSKNLTQNLQLIFSNSNPKTDEGFIRNTERFELESSTFHFFFLYLIFYLAYNHNLSGVNCISLFQKAVAVDF